MKKVGLLLLYGVLIVSFQACSPGLSDGLPAWEGETPVWHDVYPSSIPDDVYRSED
jgi:hypothetical protein